jgi:hypothetical protein
MNTHSVSSRSLPRVSFPRSESESRWRRRYSAHVPFLVRVPRGCCAPRADERSVCPKSESETELSCSSIFHAKERALGRGRHGRGQREEYGALALRANRSQFLLRLMVTIDPRAHGLRRPRRIILRG